MNYLIGQALEDGGSDEDDEGGNNQHSDGE